MLPVRPSQLAFPVAERNVSSKANLMNTPACRSITAETVDNAVAERLLAALNPQEVALAWLLPTK